MSRKTREIGLEHRERWPELARFLGCYLHEDWPVQSGSPEAAVHDAISDFDLPGLKLVASQWWDWNASPLSYRNLIDSVNDGLGVNVRFDTAAEARAFMNTVYDKVIVQIRQTEPAWKPSRQLS